VLFRSGDSIVIDEPPTTPVELLAGDDVLIITPAGLPSGTYIDGGADIDTIELADVFSTFNLTLLGPNAALRNFEILDISNNGLGISTASVSLSLTPRAIEDALELTGTGAIDVVGGEGSDLLALLGVLTGDVDLKAGNDEFYLVGQLNGDVELGSGSDLLGLNGGSFSGFIDAGAGDDTIQVGADIFNFDLGQIDPTGALRNFETLAVAAPATLDLTGANTSSINVLGDDDADAITISGSLTGGVDLLDGANQLTLNGTLIGDATFGAGADWFVLGGTLTGNATLGAGEDVLTLGGGSFNGTIDGGADNDAIALLAEVTTFNLSQLGSELLNFENLDIDATGSLTLTGANVGSLNVLGGASANVLTLEGVLDGGVSLGEGDDLFVLAGGSFTGLVDGGLGTDTLSLMVTAATFDLGTLNGSAPAGNFTGFEAVGIAATGIFVVTGTGTANISGSDGGDAFTLSGALTGSINLLGGADTFTLNGGSFTDFVNGGDGVDTLVLLASDTIFDLGQLGASAAYRNFETLDVSRPSTVTLAGAGAIDVLADTGSEMLTLEGSLTGDVDLGDGADAFDISTGGVLIGDAALGAGDDTFTLAGTLTGGANLGAGADAFAYNGGTFSGVIDGGEDTDTVFILNNTFDLTQFGAGLVNFEGLDISTTGSVTLTGANTQTVNVLGGDNANVLTLEGVLNGGANLGGGDDTFVLAGGSFTGLVDGGLGMDTLSVRITSTTFDLDTLTGGAPAGNFTGFEQVGIAGSGSFSLSGAGTANVSGSDGADAFVLSGALTGSIDLLGGTDRFTLDGGSFTDFVDAGAGSDVLALLASDTTFNLSDLGASAVYRNFEILDASSSGSLVLTGVNATAIWVEGGAGADVVALAQGSSLTGRVYLYDGADTFVDTGGLNAAVFLGDGDDTFVRDGSTTIFQHVDGGAGIDTVAFGSADDHFGLNLLGPGGYESIEILDVAAPTGLFTTSGTGAADVRGGDDADTVRLTIGVLTGDVDLLGGDDEFTITVSTTQVGDVQLGAGADTFTLEGTLTGGGSLGAGADVLVLNGGSFSGVIDGGDDVDTVRLGGGAHALDLAQVPSFEIIDLNGSSLSLSGASSFTSVVGGAGTDVLTLIGVLTGDVDLMDGVDTLTLAAGSTLVGDAQLGDGNDIVVLGGGDFAGFIDGGAGSVDVLELSATTTSFDVSQFGASATYRGFEVLDVGATSAIELTGTGAIDRIVGDASDDAVTVTGDLIGRIFVSTGTNEVTIASGASFTGDVGFHVGTDTFTLADGATINGDIELGAGDDTFNWAATGVLNGVIDANSAAGFDTVVLGPGWTSVNLNRLRNFETMDISASAGTPLQITGAGTLGVLGSEASDDVRVFALMGGGISLLGGADTLTISATVGGDVDLGSGDDVLEVGSGATVSGYMDGGAGTDIFILRSGGAFDLGQNGTATDGSLRNFEVLNLSNVFDPITLTGVGVIDVFGGAGSTDLTVAGNLTGDISLSLGSDVLTVTGVLTGNVSRAETFTLAAGGVFNGNALFGGGNQVVKLEGGAFSGTFDGGQGEDTITLGVGATLTSLSPFANFETLSVSGGALSPGGTGVVGAMAFNAAAVVSGPNLLLQSNAALLVDWGVGDTYDTVDVNLAGGSATLDGVTVTFNVLPGASIDDGDTADLVTADIVNPLGAVTFSAVPSDLAAVGSIASIGGGRQAFRVTFEPVGSSSAASAMATPEMLEGGGLLTSASLGGALDAVGFSSGPVGVASLADSAAGWAAFGSDGAQVGFTRRSFMTTLGGAPAQADAQATRSLVGGTILDGRAVAGFGAGMEEIRYRAEGDSSRDGMSGRARSSYLAGFVATEVAGWELIAAADAGPVSLRFNGAALGTSVETSGRRTRTELTASRALALAGVPLHMDFGVRSADLRTNPFRRDDGLWTQGPSARFTAASAGLALGEAGGFVPYVRLSAPIRGETEAWRVMGVRRELPHVGFSFDASIGDVTEAYDHEQTTRGEVRLNWTF